MGDRISHKTEKGREKVRRREGRIGGFSTTVDKLLKVQAIQGDGGSYEEEQE